MNPSRNARLHWRRALLATTAALSLGQNAAWATCLDGTTFPPGGYQIGCAPVAVAANWSPNVFTTRKAPTSSRTARPPIRSPAHPQRAGTTGPSTRARHSASRVMPAAHRDYRVDPAAEHLHRLHRPADHQEWRRDQPRRHPVPGLGRHPGLRSDQAERSRISPTVTTPLPNPLNTYANQLGCSIAAFNNGGVPVATTAATAPSFMFVAGIKGGLFHYELDNAGPIGKTVGSFSYYRDIPEGLKLHVRIGEPGRPVCLRRVQPPQSGGDLGVHRSAGQPRRPCQAAQPRLLRAGCQLGVLRRHWQQRPCHQPGDRLRS